MKFNMHDILAVAFLFVISFFFVFDLFFINGQPATFDGPMHITVTAQVYRALTDGEKRVMWADGFGNYGMPIPLIHQQAAAYLGSIINFLVKNVIVSTNIVIFVGAFFSCVFLYFFMRIYFSVEAALAGVFLFNFSSYRIFNIYIRGALPEFFASIFAPLILIGIYCMLSKKTVYGFFLTAISVALIILSHPFMLVISSFLIAPYTIYLLWSTNHKLKKLAFALVAFLIGIGLTSYYMVPLNLEIKYFYYGLLKNHLTPNQFIGGANYFGFQWYYFFKDSIAVRGNFIQFGLLETLLLCCAFAFTLYFIFSKQIKKNMFILPWVISSILFIFFTTKYSNLIYQEINILGNIQHPWRMLSGLLFIPPIILAFIIDKTRYTQILLIATVLFVSILRFPQVYGKNFVSYPQSHYFYTKENLAAVVLNPIWTGKSEDYPLHPEKVGILEGSGVIKNVQLRNSTRKYTVDAKTDLRMIDYTFYFPGWNIFIDNNQVPIEYQDPKYRGVITYHVPRGVHTIMIMFANTKVRVLADIISIGFVMLFVMLFMIRHAFWAIIWNNKNI